MAYLGFEGEPTKQKITRLRKASFAFTNDSLRSSLELKLKENGFIDFEIKANEETNTSTDPHSLNLIYKSVAEKSDYIAPIVKLEVGARSLMEPFESREIQSFVGHYFNEQKFADAPVLINTVNPRRTFLEKSFLLHEEFQRPNDKIRSERMSRHLYDLEKIMDTNHGLDALKDVDLYNSIINHRKTFTNMEGVDYTTHRPDKIDFVPPLSIIKDFEKDYKGMQESMIYGDSMPFNELIERMVELRSRFRSINKKPILFRIRMKTKLVIQKIVNIFKK